MVEDVKTRTNYICQSCGYKSPKWLGKCPECGEWNSLIEEVEEVVKPGRKKAVSSIKPKRLSEIKNVKLKRIKTETEEMDRVLGGGIVPGSLVLLGGDPGIGKSTLLLQSAERIADKGRTVLYVSGEESVEQLKIRANRMGVESDNLLFLPETDISLIEEAVRQEKPDVLIIDSVQTMVSPDLASAPGSVSQVREAANRLMRLAKRTGTAVLLVGHVTKEGNLAGPRVLEHMVDTVLYFEGERYHSYRILRATKNRFGATNEIGMFEMEGSGLSEVSNPSEVMLASRPKNTCGSVVIPTLEGSRPLLLELQGLVSESGYPTARRMATGYDYNRMILLIAIMEKRLGISLKELDCYSNIVGGIRSDEPALDLAVIMALYSSLINKEVPPDLFAFGEVGLTGEVREVGNAQERIKEAARLGFKKCVCPSRNVKSLGENRPDIEFYPVENISEALSLLSR